MMPGQDPRQAIQEAGEEPSLRRRYPRQPEQEAPPIQFNMQPADYGSGQEPEEEYEPTQTPPSQNYHAQNYQPQEQPQYELDEEDDELFPGGPAESEVLSWKKQHNNRVYIIEINEDVFIFRRLTRYEYKQIVAIPNLDPLMREEIICETCVLWPKGLTWQNVASQDAGLPAMVAENILDKSGFTKNIRVNLL